VETAGEQRVPEQAGGGVREAAARRPGKEVVIDVRGVVWERDGRRILDHVDWTVRQGEHWALLGRNGSGKTTLLSMITGYIWPMRGRVSVLGHRYGTVDLRELRRRIGWVSSALQERVHPREVAGNLVVSGLHAATGLFRPAAPEHKAKALEIMETLGCAHVARREYRTCSHGEKQMLLIARALMASPELLILDEPCTGLDFVARQGLLDGVAALARRADAPTILYVTHHVEEIFPELTHALLLRDGRVVARGLAREVLTAERLSDMYGVPVTVHRHHGRTWLTLAEPGLAAE
jgi:ABC-type molybdenum transport system, ATPase component/photorepair protein PhrA